MEEKTHWSKGHTFAIWVTGGGIIVLTWIAYWWPSDPAHPMGPHYLSVLAGFAHRWLFLEIPLVGILGAIFGGNFVKRKGSTASIGASTPTSGQIELFEFHSAILDQRVTDPSRNIYNTAKLRLYLTNKTEKSVQVLAPKWLMSSEEISVQCGLPPYPDVPYKPGMMGFGYQYQLEAYQGSWKDEKWKMNAAGKDDELRTITIAPGYTFRIWIALNPCVPHSELEQRRKTRRLGTLILPVSAGGETSDWKIPL